MRVTPALLALMLGAAGLAATGLHSAALAAPHGCINPAGHPRGWCKGERGESSRGNNNAVVSGTVISANGDLAALREDNGTTVTVNEQNLLRAGSPLHLGGHYVLQGYWSNSLFVAENTGGQNGNGGNGYPGASASVHGVITGVNGNRVTILQGLFTTIAVDDQQALNRGAAQNLYVGRSVTAYGFWSGSVFYASAIN